MTWKLCGLWTDPTCDSRPEKITQPPHSPSRVEHLTPGQALPRTVLGRWDYCNRPSPFSVPLQPLLRTLRRKRSGGPCCWTEARPPLLASAQPLLGSLGSQSLHSGMPITVPVAALAQSGCPGEKAVFECSGPAQKALALQSQGLQCRVGLSSWG